MNNITNFKNFRIVESSTDISKLVGQFLLFVNHIKCAHEYIESIIRDKPNTQGAQLARKLKMRTEGIYNDLMTTPIFNDSMRTQIRNEWKSDAFAIQALHEKIGLLSPQQRDVLEKIVDSVLNGEEIKIV